MGAGPGDEGAGETPVLQPGLPGGQWPGVLCQEPSTPPRPRHEVLDFGGPGLVNGGLAVAPLGAQSTDIP